MSKQKQAGVASNATAIVCVAVVLGLIPLTLYQSIYHPYTPPHGADTYIVLIGTEDAETCMRLTTDETGVLPIPAGATSILRFTNGRWSKPSGNVPSAARACLN